jgi:hypothetical protein
MLTAVFALSLLTSPQEVPRPWKTRAEFARRLHVLEEGDPVPAAQALAMFGSPDDVWGGEEAVFVDSYRSRPMIDAIWRYGCKDHFAPASYGEIEIRGGVAFYRSGKTGGEHYADLPSEAKFQELFQILSSPRRDMLHIVRMVNALTALGEKQALAVMQEHTPHDFILVLYLLYGMPPEDHYLSVRFVHGIPIPSSAGGLGSAFGRPPDLDQVIKDLQERGEFRKEPLRHSSDVRELASALYSLRIEGQSLGLFYFRDMTSSLLDGPEHFPVKLEAFLDLLGDRKVVLDPVAYEFVWADRVAAQADPLTVRIFAFEHDTGVSLYVKQQGKDASVILRAPRGRSTVRVEFPAHTLVLRTGVEDAMFDENWSKGFSGTEDWQEFQAYSTLPLKQPLAEARITDGDRLIFSGPMAFKTVPRHNQPRPAKDLVGL